MSGEEWKPEYLCLLDPGCNGTGHSLYCRDCNRAYAVTQRAVERKWRLNKMGYSESSAAS